MNKITFPLKAGNHGASVADLHVALRNCLERVAILANDPQSRGALSERLRGEAEARRYADVTAKVVSIFQKEKGLDVNGEVDERTAEALNALLKEWGLLDHESSAATTSIVVGRVIQFGEIAVSRVLVVAEHVFGGSAIRLGEDTTGDDGRYTIRYAPLPGVDSIDLRVSVFGRDDKVIAVSDVFRGAADVQTVDVSVPALGERPNVVTIGGSVAFESGVAAGDLRLRLFRREFGGSTTQLSETITSGNGTYEFSVGVEADAFGFEIRAVIPDGTETSISNAIHPRPGKRCNLIVPDKLRPQPIEYRTLAADIAGRIGGNIASLATAREGGGRDDLTLLNRATGWDARLIALAATAEQIRNESGNQLSSEAVYGLLRAGLPSDITMLSRVEPETVEQALKIVRDAEVVTLTDDEITGFKENFRAFAESARLAASVPGSATTYDTFLQESGIDDPIKRSKFASAFFNRADGENIWEKAESSGLDTKEIGMLQRQGKYSFLTGNSAPMTATMMRKPIDDLSELVDQDFHTAEKWMAEVRSATANDEARINEAIPAAYTGATDERLRAYADDMALMVRHSFPTKVVSRMLENRKIEFPEAQDATVSLLREAGKFGFRLGETPANSFFQRRPEIAATVAEPERETAKRQLKSLQRVYQLTPSDEAMPVLLELGFKAAHDIVVCPEDRFVDQYKKKYIEKYNREPEPSEPKLIYRKAIQVTSVIHNVFAIAKKMDSEAGVFALAAAPERSAEAKNELVKQFPTMEQLFGTMDFCECGHCLSVLSPSAYFVDLLQFIDADQESVQAVSTAPYEVLRRKRPDIPHIPLTCENTHTEMPYIDIVNEILEYCVAHGELRYEAVRDTGTSRSEDLIAEPNNVIAATYEILRTEAVYPVGLPFDLWTETVRALFGHFGLPLHEILEAFRRGDALIDDSLAYDRYAAFVEALGISEGEEAIFSDPNPLDDRKWLALFGFPTAASVITNVAVEETDGVRNTTVSVADDDARLLRAGFACGFIEGSTNAASPNSKHILTVGERGSGGNGVTVIAFDGEWAPAPEVNDLLFCDGPAMLSSAKTLARRLGITYAELLKIVRSEFVNPRLPDLSILNRLGVSIHDARSYLDNKVFIPAVPEALSAENRELRLEAIAFQERIADLARDFGVSTAELEANIAAVPFAETLVLADPKTGCSFENTTVNFADGRSSQPIDLLRINLFTRLWRKLGWSIEETDQALQTFMPKNAPFDTANLGKQPFKTALIYISHFRAIEKVLKIKPKDRSKFMLLWSDIPVSGTAELYRRLFLTGNSSDKAVFDSVYGRYLQYFDPVAHRFVPFRFDSTRSESIAAGNVSLREHLPAVLAAVNMSVSDVTSVLADNGLSLDAAALSAATISLLYRFGTLARALKLTVDELIALKDLSGLDPFFALHDEPLHRLPVPSPPAIELDRMFSQTMRFIEIANKVDQSGIDFEGIEYLLRHRFDPAGKFRTESAAATEVLTELQLGIRAIRSTQLEDDPKDPPEVAEPKREAALKQRIEEFVKQAFTSRFSADVLLVGNLLRIKPLPRNADKTAIEILSEADLRQDPPDPLKTIDELRCVRFIQKALHVTTTFGLNHREFDFFAEHGKQMYPTISETEQLAEVKAVVLESNPGLSDEQATVEAKAELAEHARTLFAQFVRIADYSRLRSELRLTGDELAGVLLASDREEQYKLFASLLRSHSDVVKEAAEIVLGNRRVESESELLRLSLVLRCVDRFGVTATSLRSWLSIVNPTTPDDERFRVATECKNAVKAKYGNERWTRVAGPIFDILRAKKRDALSAYIIHANNLASRDQLYEHLLIDPGMEPVVRTSRIRLAIASVQLFIQRCLLNLEPDVAPSAINSKHWEWMKRYRVWEANRKIFLFPENWLEPEFRDEKTHLFTELEGLLLQGDVSNDLAEDALLNYLRKLDELARLEIVGLHLEDDSDPIRRRLHVIGRTFNSPPQYFYRRYANDLWLPWEPVGVEIQGNHIAPAIWLDRLYLFWVTFMEKPLSEDHTQPAGGDVRLANMSLTDVITGAKQAAGSGKLIDMQLNWSEYVRGEWTPAKSSGFVPTKVSVERPWRPPAFENEIGVAARVTGASVQWVEIPKKFDTDYDPNYAPVAVSLESADKGGGISIHVGGHIEHTFYLAGRNATPEIRRSSIPPSTPFSFAGIAGSRLTASGGLFVHIDSVITVTDDNPPVTSHETPAILARGGNYFLTPCNNKIGSIREEIAPLTQPAFYQDVENTFYLEPTLIENTIETWDDWVTPPPRLDPGINAGDWWKNIDVVRVIPPASGVVQPVNPLDDLVGGSIVKPGTRRDWLVNDDTRFIFNGETIGPKGRSNVTRRGDLAILAENDPASASGETTGRTVNVVGPGGLNGGLADNLIRSGTRAIRNSTQGRSDS